MEQILAKANELGQLLKDCEATQKMVDAETDVNADTALQAKLSDFNEKRGTMMEMMQGGDEDKTAIDALNAEIRTLYNDIMESVPMKAYNDAKAEFDVVFSKVNAIINYYITGEEAQEEGGCGGGCSSCSGCH